MARQKKKTDKAAENVVDYRHKRVKRLNIPPAGLTARGEIVREKKVRYAYNPHFAPASISSEFRQPRSKEMPGQSICT
jgi:hypothetical protein